MNAYLSNTKFWVGVVVGVLLPIVFRYARAMVGARGGRGQAEY